MNYVKSYLKRNKLTQEQLASKLDMSLSAVEKIANGRMKLRAVVKYALLWLEQTKK